MSLGDTLRAAREAKGITTSELAVRTHMLVQTVEGLESEDFRKIPAPIYGRGFVKLYCEEVGLDPKPLQAEFMELYAQNKTGRRPDPEPAPRVPPAREDAHSATPGTAMPGSTAAESASCGADIPGGLFDQSTAGDAAKPAETPVQTGGVAAPVPPKRSYEDLFGQSYANDSSEKISAPEKFRETMSNVSKGVFSNVKRIHPNTARIAIVAACGLMALILAAWGISELYKATSGMEALSNRRESAPEAQASGADRAPAKKAKSAKPSAGADAAAARKPAGRGKLKSSGIDVPPLYID